MAVGDSVAFYGLSGLLAKAGRYVCGVVAGTALWLAASSPVYADDSVNQRRHSPLVNENPIRLEWPPRMVAVGSRGEYTPQNHVRAIDGIVLSPWAAAVIRFSEGSSHSQRENSLEIRTAAGFQRSYYGFEIAPHYLGGDFTSNREYSSTSVDSQGLTNQTSEKERTDTSAKRYGVALSGNRGFGAHGDLSGRFVVARVEDRETTDLSGLTSVSGTINVPGADQPVTVNASAPFSTKVTLRHFVTALDGAVGYDFGWTKVIDGVQRFSVGPWAGYAVSSTTANVQDQSGDKRIVDESLIRRSGGGELVFTAGVPSSGRFFVAGRGGADAVKSSARFTGQAVAALSGRPFDSPEMWTFALSAGGRAGREVYSASVFWTPQEQGKNPDEQDAVDKTIRLEHALTRTATLNSGHDERFDEKTRVELRRDIFQNETHALGAVGLSGGFEKVRSDRAFGAVSVPITRAIDPGLSHDVSSLINISVYADGFWGHDGKKGDSRQSRRDYGWSTGGTVSLSSWAQLNVRVERSATPTALETVVRGGLVIFLGPDSKPRYVAALDSTNPK